MDFWTAFDAVEPIGEAWRQTATTNTLLERQIEYEAAKNGAVFEPATVDSHMPARYVPEHKPKQTIPQRINEADFAAFGRSAGLTEVLRKHGRINQPS